jgi:hypothetical protein
MHYYSCLDKSFLHQVYLNPCLREGGREGVEPQQCHVGGDHIKLNIIRAHLDYDEEAYRLGVFRECSNTIGYKNGFFFAQVLHYIQDVSGGQLQS